MRVCPRCGNVNCVITEADGPLCILCGHRPEGTDPGATPVPAMVPVHYSGHGLAMKAEAEYRGTN